MFFFFFSWIKRYFCKGSRLHHRQQTALNLGKKKKEKALQCPFLTTVLYRWVAFLYGYTFSTSESCKMPSVGPRSRRTIPSWPSKMATKQTFTAKVDSRLSELPYSSLRAGCRPPGFGEGSSHSGRGDTAVKDFCFRYSKKRKLLFNPSFLYS